jgi:hypothetical protein
MLFKETFIKGIRNDSITVTFRRWRAPRVRIGGCYRLRPDLMIRVGAVNAVPAGSIATRDVTRTGFASKAALLRALAGAGTIYRIEFERIPATPDPRGALANTALTAATKAAVEAKLSAMDRRSQAGAWTQRVLTLIRDHPGRRAADLAQHLGLPTAELKTRVRRLKALGLTESLEVGYRLSRRGRTLVAGKARP